MDLFTYLMAKKGHNTHRDLFSYLLGKNAGGSGTYTTFSGTSLNISNTLQARIKNIALEGNTSQVTTTGKQLLDTSMYSLGSINGNTGEDETSSSVYRFDKYNEVNPNTTIYLLKHLCIYFYNENKGFISSDITGNLTITTPPNTKYIRFRIFGADFATFNPNDYMVSYTQETHFEPYTGGQPSPSPNYPQDIKVVTGEQNITIQNKNLCDVSQGYRRGYINANGGAFKAENVSYVLNQYIEVTGGNTYTYSTNQPINNMAVYSYNESKEFIKREKLVYSKKVCTVTVDSNAKYILLGGNYNNYNAITQAILNGLDIQLENGPTATTYTPYQLQIYPLSLGNIELAKIGNYKDYIFKNVTGSPYYNADLDLNEWYLYKIIDKLTLNGSETYIYQSNYARFLYAHNISNLSIGDVNKSLCNYFIYGTQNNNFYINNTYLYFYASDYTSADNFKNFVQEKYENGNALTVYVPLATPTNTKITDTTLIQQLENINNNAHSYKDTTIIECTSASTDNETIVLSGDIKVTSVGNSLNTSLLSSNLQEETNTNDIQEEPNLDEIEEHNDEPIEEEVS